MTTGCSTSGYSGKNGHGYVSIGRVLIDRGEVPKEQMSMKAIKRVGQSSAGREREGAGGAEPSYVFFERRPTNDVVGAAGIPLLPMAAVAADKTLLPMGTLSWRKCRCWTKRATGPAAPAAAADCAGCGGAVKKGHLDLYHGMGRKAGVGRSPSTLAGSGSWVCTTGRPPPPGCNACL